MVKYKLKEKFMYTINLLNVIGYQSVGAGDLQQYQQAVGVLERLFTELMDDHAIINKDKLRDLLTTEITSADEVFGEDVRINTRLHLITERILPQHTVNNTEDREAIVEQLKEEFIRLLQTEDGFKDILQITKTKNWLYIICIL